MFPGNDQILTAGQMRAAEQGLIARGIGAHELMQRAGRGAAQWVWRLAGQRPVTVLCGPGNNGGDGYVIAQALHERGGKVVVIAATAPKTDAARTAAGLYGGEILGAGALPRGEILVDCLFGTGLARPLEPDHLKLLQALATSHCQRIAIDLPSGVECDSGMVLNQGLPHFDLTLALGAWKFAHWLMPASALTGMARLVEIGVEPVAGAARQLARPCLAPPAADAHKYTRGLLGVIGGEMQGAALLCAMAAQGAGAGYVRLLGRIPDIFVPPDLVLQTVPLADALADGRMAALLAGPGLGRSAAAREQLALCLATAIPAVLDADALVLLRPAHLAGRSAPLIATPHEGELIALERSFDLDGSGSKADRATALAMVSNMVIVAKGPDTVIAAPDGRITCAPRASSWLSTAGTGDVLAGTIASRLASGAEAYTAACEGVWLHGEAARLCPPGFTAGQLARTIQSAYAAAL